MEPSLLIGIGPPKAISGQRKPSLSIWNETSRSATPTLRWPERLDLIGGSGLPGVGLDRPGAWPQCGLGVHRLVLAACVVGRSLPVQAPFTSIAQAPMSACKAPNTRVRRLAGTAASSRSVRSPRDAANFRASAWTRIPGAAPTAALPKVQTPWRRLPSGRAGVVADPCGTPAGRVAPVQPRRGLCSQSVFVQRGRAIATSQTASSSAKRKTDAVLARMHSCFSGCNPFRAPRTNAGASGRKPRRGSPTAFPA